MSGPEDDNKDTIAPAVDTSKNTVHATAILPIDEHEHGASEQEHASALRVIEIPDNKWVRMYRSVKFQVRLSLAYCASCLSVLTSLDGTAWRSILQWPVYERW